MHPIVSEQLARLHGEDLARDAAAARRVARARSRGARPVPAPAGPVRRAVGLRLVDVGQRLAGAR